MFKALHVITWAIFIGLSIEAGGLLVNFGFSIFNPSFVDKLYQKLDLSAMYNRSHEAFYAMYGFANLISVLKVYLFYMLIMLMMKLDLNKPFSSFVSNQITKLSYITFCIGIFCFVAQQIANELEQRGFETAKLDQFWAGSSAFILMSAVIYVIATIFSRGLELQAENDLTV